MGFSYNINSSDYNCYDNYRDNQIFFRGHAEEKGREIDDHYRILTGDLSRLQVHIAIQKVFPNIPRWRQEIEISSPTASNIQEDLEYHLEKDLKGSISYIQNFVNDINNHNNNVEKFVNGLRQFIERRFSEVNIILNTYPHRGLYYNNYINLLNIQLDSIIICFINNCDFDELRNTLHFEIIRNEQGFVNGAGNTIGNIEDLGLREMNRIIQEIPFDDYIVSNLENLYNNVLILETKSNEIRADLGTIIDRIERHHYRTSVKCCPKRYFFV